MKKLKLLTSLCLAATLTITSLAGCSSSNSSTGEESNDSSNSTEATTEITDITEITWWAFPNFATIDDEVGKYEKQIISDFEAKNPDVKVNLEMISFNGGGEKITAAIASNSAPDILYDAPGRIIDYGRQDVLADVDDMIKALNGDVSEEILQGCRVDDTYYMYPFNTTAFVMAANKTMFEEAGLLDLLPLEKEDRLWTIEEFEAALRGIKEANPDIIPVSFFSKSTAGDQGTRAFLANIFGGSIFNDDLSEYTLNSPEMVEALEWVNKCIDEGLIGAGSEGLTSSDAIDSFVQGKSAFTILYSTGLKANNAESKLGDFEDVLLPIPSPEGELGLEFLIGGYCVFDNQDDAKIEASKRFINFACNDEEWQVKNIKATGTFSVRDSVKDLYDDEEMKAAEAFGKYLAPYYNTVPGFAEMRTFWFPSLQEITLKQTPIQEALDKLNENANNTLNNN